VLVVGSDKGKTLYGIVVLHQKGKSLGTDDRGRPVEVAYPREVRDFIHRAESDHDDLGVFERAYVIGQCLPEVLTMFARGGIVNDHHWSVGLQIAFFEVGPVYQGDIEIGDMGGIGPRLLRCQGEERPEE
jgi:hypothetical protein